MYTVLNCILRYTGEAEGGSPHGVPMRERKAHGSYPNPLQGDEHLTFLPGNQAAPHLGGKRAPTFPAPDWLDA